MVARGCYPSTLQAQVTQQDDHEEFKASLVRVASSRLARTTQWDNLKKEKQNKKQQTNRMRSG